MKLKKSFPLGAACCLALFSAGLQAQQAGPLPAATYTADTTSAMGVTGDIQTAPGRLILSGHSIALNGKRPVTGADLKNAATLFTTDLTPDTSAALYRVHIPVGMKFNASNSFCGKLPVTYILLMRKGSGLLMAGFAGSAPPNLDPAVIGNSTNLCGTYGYVRK